MSDNMTLDNSVEICRGIWEARAIEPVPADVIDGYPHNHYAGRYDDIRAKISPGAHLALLDVGCGQGSVLGRLRRNFRSVVGVDISEASLRRLTEIHGDIQVHRASAHKLPFPDNSFDRVLLYGVLHYMPTWDGAERVIRELVRVCRPSGVVLVGDNQPVVNNAYDPPLVKAPQFPSESRPGQFELCFTKEFFVDLAGNIGCSTTFSRAYAQPGHFDVTIGVLKPEPKTRSQNEAQTL